MTMRERLTWEAGLQVGDQVIVWWGHGSGFRAKGRGVIDAVFPKSFRVRLTEEASGVGGGSLHTWPAGLVLKGIPRVFSSERWHPNFCVEPPEAGEAKTAGEEAPRLADGRDVEPVFNVPPYGS